VAINVIHTGKERKYMHIEMASIYAHTHTLKFNLPGCAAEARYAAKAASYARDYRPPPDDVQLLFFSVETSGFIHQ
jgi:hypothetical protein